MQIEELIEQLNNVQSEYRYTEDYSSRCLAMIKIETNNATYYIISSENHTYAPDNYKNHKYTDYEDDDFRYAEDTKVTIIDNYDLSFEDLYMTIREFYDDYNIYNASMDKEFRPETYVNLL